MSRERRAVRIVATAATVAILGALAIVLSHSEHHRTGTNSRDRAISVNVPPRTETCQPVQGIPAGTGRIAFYGESNGAPAGPVDLRVVLAGSRAVVARARLARRVYDSAASAVASIRPLPRDVGPSAVCIRNGGGGTLLVQGQVLPSFNGAARLPKVHQLAVLIGVHLDYQEARSRTWWAFAPRVADRFALVKATFFGPWTMWVTLIGLVLLCVGTVWFAAREVGG